MGLLLMDLILKVLKKKQKQKLTQNFKKCSSKLSHIENSKTKGQTVQIQMR